MKALTYHGPGRRTWGEVPDPVVRDPEDAVVRVDAVTICGTDLHILKGDVPKVAEGRTLGHEAVGTVTDTGSRLRTITVGDRVLVSCISACGRCSYCRAASYGQCTGGGGWILGHLIDGAARPAVCGPPGRRGAGHPPFRPGRDAGRVRRLRRRCRHRPSRSRSSGRDRRDRRTEETSS
ncbi:alcohol dehydrogenase catalytic domain-containing protein [Kitasatospora sp. NPDC056531]|uniref:alcohol dehydrogenase catalytic domain-containing protein n=1 Tax=Kitasatospora sp. NPDC056531 TaxID=3345856 RepID=UPI0036B2CAF1